MKTDNLVKILLITNVDYDNANEYIVKVKARFITKATEDADSESKSKSLDRKKILELMDEGYLVLTIVTGPNGAFGPAEVTRYYHQKTGKIYLTTRIFTPRDNLGTLPTMEGKHRDTT